MTKKRLIFDAGFTFSAALALLTAPAALKAQDMVDFFRSNCVSCHTIGGGRLTGPDLKDVTQKKDRAWLVQFMQSPQAMMDKGDEYALKLKDEARGVVMPNINGMTPALAEQLLTMIDAESKLEHSQFAGAQISNRPFTAHDVEVGREIFTGHNALINGGPPCLNCHTFNGLGGFSGGKLGPDLTKAYERLQGRKGLGAWLFAPATPTMNATFKNHALKPDEEILPLLALFESTSKEASDDNRAGIAGFFAAGFVATLVCLGLFAVIWNYRLRGVRRPMVEMSARKVLGGRS